MLILDLQYKMRWFPTSVFKSESFFSLIPPSFPIQSQWIVTRLIVYPPWPKEWHCTGETTSSCWFYCRAMKWQISLKWIGSTVRPRHWARRCCWHPSSCTALSQKVSESPGPRAFGPHITGPSHLPCPAEEKRCQKLFMDTSALTVLPQERTEFSCWK